LIKHIFSNETANVNFEHYNNIAVDVFGTEIPEALITACFIFLSSALGYLLFLRFRSLACSSCMAAQK